MPWRSGALAGAICALALLVAPTPAEALRTDDAAAPVRTLGLLAIADGQPQHLGDVRRYAYVVVQSWFGDTARRVHATSPGTDVLAYLETSAVRKVPCVQGAPLHADFDPSPVGYCWIRAHHPRWLLRDRRHRELTFDDFPDYVAVDIGRPGYQRAWAASAVRIAATGGFDGVYLDDVSINPTHGLAGRMVRYSGRQYGAATTAFASYAGDALAAHHLLSMANTGVNPWQPWQVRDALAMAPHVDVVNREFSVRWGTYCGAHSGRFTNPATAGNPALDTVQDFREQVEATGAHVAGVDYGHRTPSAGDVATMRYGRASFLLTWDGRPGAAYFFRTCGRADPADPNWEVELGTPTSPVRTTHGVLARDYTGGLVLLNPSPSRVASVPLAGRYVDPDGTPVLGSIRLAPRTAQLLRGQPSG